MTSPKRWTLFALLAAALTLAVFGFRYIDFTPEFLLTPLRTFGSPLRAGDRVYLFTGQWRSLLNLDLDSSPRDKEADLLVDLWAFDARTATPLWRKRVQTERNGAMDGRSLLGAEGNTLWLLVPKGLVAASLATGDLLADPATIESRNPSLRGLLPREDRFIRFDAQGLWFRAADGRDWRLDPQTFAARPASAPATSTAVIPPAFSTPNSTGAFHQRGLLMPCHWLGLLADNEVASMRDKQSTPDLDSLTRRRLWSARTGEGTNFFGKFTTYSDFQPIGDEYLGPALLSVHARQGQNQPILLRDPDSVLVLHHDRLGEEGRLRIDRIAGPKGNTLWKADIPMSVLQALMPGDRSLVLYGVLFTPPKDDHPRDPFHTAREMLISLDLATGQVHAHDQAVVDRHPKAVPAAGP